MFSATHRQVIHSKQQMSMRTRKRMRLEGVLPKSKRRADSHVRASPLSWRFAEKPWIGGRSGNTRTRRSALPTSRQHVLDATTQTGRPERWSRAPAPNNKAVCHTPGRRPALRWQYQVEPSQGPRAGSKNSRLEISRRSFIVSLVLEGRRIAQPFLKFMDRQWRGAPGLS